MTEKNTACRFSLSQLSGPWLMAEDRVKSFLNRMSQATQHGGKLAELTGATGPAAYKADGDGDEDGSVEPVSYGIVNGMAVIQIVGILTKYPMPEAWMDEWCGTVPALAIEAALDRAMADWTVRGVVLLIDSPGGMVAGTNQLAEAVAAYADSQPDKPIYAVVSDLAASGGYYVASQCRSITCNAMGEVGCIGVYCVLCDDSKFWGDLGVTYTVVGSGGVKGLGADGVVSQELIDDQKRGVMAMYDKFVADVAGGRGISIEQARQLGDGRCWIAPEALKLGLIDAVGSVDSALVAATQETQRMNAEAFNTYAAEHPEATERFIKQGYDKGKAEATPKPATIQELEAAFPGRDAFVIGQLKAGATLAAASVAAVAIINAEKAASDKANADAVKAITDAKDAEIAKLTQERDQAVFAASGQKPIGTAGGSKEREKEAAGGNAAAPEDPGDDASPEQRAEWAKAQATHEWEANAKGERKSFSTKDRFVAYRTAELTGRHRSLSK